MNVFSKLHQYEDRHLFKTSWENWSNENREMIELEMRRLYQLGYTGDVMLKMFKSARYYFRKKTDNIKEPKKRSTYICLPRDVLISMDNHILQNAALKPSASFDLFCCNYSLKNITETKKLKKTFQNRHFVCLRKNIPKVIENQYNCDVVCLAKEKVIDTVL